jgi:hypothetical protein
MLYVTLAVIAALGISSAGAQTTGTVAGRLMSVTGMVKAASSSSLILEANRGEMTFAVKPSTRLVSKGKPRDLLWRERGPRLTDIVKAGDRVTVAYRLSGDAPTAVQVRVVQPGER